MHNHIQDRYYLTTLIFYVFFILTMMITSFLIIQPFIIGLCWSVMVVITTWPLFIKLQNMLWGKRILAVIVMILLLILFFVIPIALLVNSVLINSEPLIAWASSPANMHFPKMEWLNSIPLIGIKIYNNWHSLVEGGVNAFLEKLRPYVGEATTWFVAQAANLWRFIVHLILMVLFSVLFYFNGEKFAQSIRRFAVRLADTKGDYVVVLAAQSIRAVALGLVVTALIQSFLGGIALAIAGIPYATLLTVLMFILCVIQLGTLLVLIPVIIWLYWSGDTTWGSILLVWSGILGTFDAVLRSVLICRSADLPMILILFGVIGGLLSLGMIGLFIGPVILAVSYSLILAWINEENV